MAHGLTNRRALPSRGKVAHIFYASQSGHSCHSPDWGDVDTCVHGTLYSQWHAQLSPFLHGLTVTDLPVLLAALHSILLCSALLCSTPSIMIRRFVHALFNNTPTSIVHFPGPPFKVPYCPKSHEMLLWCLCLLPFPLRVHLMSHSSLLGLPF